MRVARVREPRRSRRTRRKSPQPDRLLDCLKPAGIARNTFLRIPACFNQPSLSCRAICTDSITQGTPGEHWVGSPERWDAPFCSEAAGMLEIGFLRIRSHFNQTSLSCRAISLGRMAGGCCILWIDNWLFFIGRFSANIG